MASLTGAKVAFKANPALQRGDVNKLLDAVAGGTNGSGDEFGITAPSPGEGAVSAYSVSSSIGGSGSFTSFNIDVEGSLDGTHWFVLISLTNVNGEMQFIAGQKIRFIRANKTADVVAAGAPTVTVICTY